MALTRVVFAISSTLLGWLSIAMSASAQIVPDSTLPNPTVVEVDGDTFNITGGTEAGVNLFHSFEDFSVPTNSSAFFNNPIDIENIITRVTGGRLSNIDGLIQTNETANLFLINPAGILFGPNAQLDIGGSFFGSTASSLQFEDGTEFSAVNPQQSLLTIAVPIGLQYGTNPAEIQVQSQDLAVEQGATLALLGGDVVLENATVSAPGGSIELGGLAAEGTISFTETEGFTFPDSIARGNVFASNQSHVDVTHEGGGNLTVRANDITLSQGSELLAGIAETSTSPDYVAGDSVAGNIIIDATGAVTLDGNSLISNNILANATGTGGDIEITADSLSLTNQASLDAGSFGTGNAGNIYITTNGNVSLQNSKIYSDVSTGSGNAGNISMTTNGNVSLQNSKIYSDVLSGNGNAGEISIEANEIVNVTENSEIRSDVINDNNDNETSGGIAGSITISGNRGVTITDSSLTSESFTDERSDAFGSIHIIAREGSVYLNLNSDPASGSQNISTSNSGSGYAGNIYINATDAIEIVNSDITSEGEVGFISIGTDENISTESEESLTPYRLTIHNSHVTASNAREDGRAGGLYLGAAETVRITDSGLFSDAYKDQGIGGLAGHININAPDGISIGNTSLTTDSNSNNSNPTTSGIILNAMAGSIQLDGGTISATNYSSGTAGSIELKAGERVTLMSSSLFSDAYIDENTGVGGIAGNINIDAADGISIGNSSLTTDSNSDDSNLNTSGIILKAMAGSIQLDGGTISATNYSSGTAGSIGLNAGERVTLMSSSIFSDAYQKQGNGGISGTIYIDAPQGIEVVNSTISSESENDNTAGEFGNISLVAASGSVTLNSNIENSPLDPAPSTGMSRISTTNFGSGYAGDILINARDEVMILNSDLTSNGNLGIISIGEFELSDLQEDEEFGNVIPLKIMSLPREVTIARNSHLTTNNSSSLAGSEVNIPSGFILMGAIDTIAIEQDSRLEAFTERNGDGGFMILQAENGNVSISNSALDSSVQESAVGDSGKIAVVSRSVSLTQDAQLDTGTFGQGNAGDIFIRADDSIVMSGERTRIYSDVVEGATGKGGNITVEAESFSLTDGAQLETSTANDRPGGSIKLEIDGDLYLGQHSRIRSNGTATGNAGSIAIDSQALELNEATIEASTTSGEGGAIEVNVGGLIQMRDRSEIATNAGAENQPGSGGSISVNSRFLIGADNSDITANAYEGEGGVIVIDTDGTIGLQGRTKLTPFNDITAFSQQNPQLSGVVEINSTAVDTAGLVTLSESPVDVTGLVGDDLCARGEGSEFVVTGRGGLPPNPGDVLDGEPDVLEWTMRDGEAANAQTETGEVNTSEVNTRVSPSANPHPRDGLLEATGWEIDRHGKVILVADAPKVTPSSPAFRQPGCHR